MPEILTLETDLKHVDDKRKGNVPKHAPNDNPAQNLEFLKMAPKLACSPKDLS